MRNPSLSGPLTYNTTPKPRTCVQVAAPSGAATITASVTDYTNPATMYILSGYAQTSNQTGISSAESAFNIYLGTYLTGLGTVTSDELVLIVKLLSGNNENFYASIAFDQTI